MILSIGTAVYNTYFILFYSEPTPRRVCFYTIKEHRDVNLKHTMYFLFTANVREESLGFPQIIKIAKILTFVQIFANV